LVRTGVFQKGTRPRYMPKMTVDNVLDAVKHGMSREFDKALKNLTIGGGAPQLANAIVEDDGEPLEALTA
jgi:hypothetical protein